MRALLLVLVSALLLVGCGPSEQEIGQARARLGGDSSLVAHFRAAERESGVPAELLATVAWVQSGMSMNESADAHVEEHGEQGHMPREWGLMAIGSAKLTKLEDAAAKVALEPDVVAHDPRSNIRAGALLIASLAEADAASSGYRRWSAALDAYGGEALTHTVLRLLGSGFAAVDDDGGTVRVEGTGESDEIGTVQQALGYPGAKWSPAYSGNYTAASRGAATIDYVVIHTVQGSYAGCISWFKNPSANVSAHYVVRSSDGEVTQMVDDSDIAWHDACFNTPSIGIEHEGYVSEPGKWYTQAMYKGSAKLTAWLCDKYGIPKDRKHILGHNEAPDCSTHTDPGSGWNWTLYMDLVKNGGVADKDGDGVGDTTDNCPAVKNAGQTDTDKDGKGDACDGDDDGDGVGDANDNCPKVKNATQTDTDKDGKGDACDSDDDADSILDTKDNCPKIANKGQLDTDKDGKGDACDSDDDGDAVADTKDNCPTVKNATQTDTDKDGKGDACETDDDGDGVVDASDNCPKVANPEQLDTDADQKGDACDDDDDGDTVADPTDNCPLLANTDQLDTNGNGEGDACDDDADADGVADDSDVCPNSANPDQLDTDEDGLGDACDDDDDGDGVADSEDECPTAAPDSPEAAGKTGLGCETDSPGPDPDPTPGPTGSSVTSEPEQGGCATAPRAPGGTPLGLLLALLALGFWRRQS